MFAPEYVREISRIVIHQVPGFVADFTPTPSGMPLFKGTECVGVTRGSQTIATIKVPEGTRLYRNGGSYILFLKDSPVLPGHGIAADRALTMARPERGGFAL